MSPMIYRLILRLTAPEEFEEKAKRFFEKIIETVKEEKQHGR